MPKVIYQIFLDRFSTGDEEKDEKLSFHHTVDLSLRDYGQSFLGGNLQGIIKRFNHIKNLGVDTIWISPIYKTSAYHGYHTTDFFSIDERFGNKEDFRKVVEMCHENDIKIILDFVPNHCSKHHPYFLDAQKNAESKYRNWFIFTTWPNKYLCFLDISDLPKLNLENEECRQHILNAARYWIEEFNIDGYRVDHVIGPPLDFWKDLRKETTSVKKDFLLLPEIWFYSIKIKHLNTFWFMRDNGKWRIWDYIKMILVNNSRRQEIAYKELLTFFDGFFDFTLNEFIRKNYRNPAKIKKFAKKRTHLTKKSKSYVFIDNHDMERFKFLCDDDEEDYRETIKLLFSLKRPVVLYYGNEIGLSQKDHISHEGHEDREFRRFMKWNFNDKEKETLRLTKSLIRDSNSSSRVEYTTE